MLSCCCYHKGTYFQANHNKRWKIFLSLLVVVATTKVRIFKQITTTSSRYCTYIELLLLPQRYVFSSKSQLRRRSTFFENSCCCYHKGTYFQANHNTSTHVLPKVKLLLLPQRYVFSSKSQPQVTLIQAITVVVATTKVRIFKQITTPWQYHPTASWLLLLPQRYVFSSKSQQRKGTSSSTLVVVATTKVRIFKQITTRRHCSI